MLFIEVIFEKVENKNRVLPTHWPCPGYIKRHLSQTHHAWKHTP